MYKINIYNFSWQIIYYILIVTTYLFMPSDLDNFKSYNDLYGFAKGDEIIKFTARTIAKNIHSF